MKILKITLCSLLVLLTVSLFGQDASSSPSVNREIGLRFSGFNDFNLFYKKGLGNNAYRRHRFLFTNLSFVFSPTNVNVGMGYTFGKEKRKTIKDKLSFVHGWEYGLQLNYRAIDFPNSTTVFETLEVNPSLGYVFGFQLDLSDSFYISAEVIPSIQVALNFNDNGSNQHGVTAGFNSSSTALSLMYKF